MQPVTEIARTVGIDEKYIEQYGRYKAKIDLALLKDLADRPDGKLILVTAITPTPAGEGTTGIAVAHARGIILCTAAKSGIPLFEYTPMQVKQAVVGYGLAEKRQVMDMVRRLLKLKAVPRPDDAADALALAICHARSATSLLARAQNPVKQTV